MIWTFRHDAGVIAIKVGEQTFAHTGLADIDALVLLKEAIDFKLIRAKALDVLAGENPPQWIDARWTNGWHNLISFNIC